jgi:phospholipid:diacylglycerol acyltransferase
MLTQTSDGVLMIGYWIWQKIVENLATLGYDSNSMDMAAYDW